MVTKIICYLLKVCTAIIMKGYNHHPGPDFGGPPLRPRVRQRTGRRSNQAGGPGRDRVRRDVPAPRASRPALPAVRAVHEVRARRVHGRRGRFAPGDGPAESGIG